MHAAERLSHSILTRTSEAAERIERLHTLVVAEQGEIVLERTYNGPPATQPVNIKSLSKTVLAALTGAAIADGLITGVDQPVVELLGPLVPDDTDPRVEEITVGHLLSLQAGLEPTSGRHYGGGWRAGTGWPMPSPAPSLIGPGVRCSTPPAAAISFRQR
ncbi:serine hydrolase [Halomonas sp. E19]|uniref:serine hydrolase n=1 Tax=Halomonas sp. E19 TaxID=3397247 RepID=UPI0040346A66